MCRAPLKPVEEENTASVAENASYSNQAAVTSAQPSTGGANAHGDGAVPSAQMSSQGPNTHTEGVTHSEGATDVEGGTHAAEVTHAAGATDAEGGTHAGGPTDAEPQPVLSDAEQRRRRKKLWVAAIKPPLYSVAIAPVMVRPKPSCSACEWIRVLD